MSDDDLAMFAAGMSRIVVNSGKRICEDRHSFFE